MMNANQYVNVILEHENNTPQSSRARPGSLIIIIIIIMKSIPSSCHAVHHLHLGNSRSRSSRTQPSRIRIFPEGTFEPTIGTCHAYSAWQLGKEIEISSADHFFLHLRVSALGEHPKTLSIVHNACNENRAPFSYAV